MHVSFVRKNDHKFVTKFEVFDKFSKNIPKLDSKNMK